MGLDLYHFKAKAERRGRPLVVEIWNGWDSLLARFSWCTVTMYIEDQQFDILAKFYVERDVDIGHSVGEKVHVIPGIADTRTLITFRAF